MRAKKIDNFKKWRGGKIADGSIKSTYPKLLRNGDLAELIGVILGDGHICKHERCESLRIVGNSNSSEFAKRYASLIEKVFKKKAHVAVRNKENAVNITIYEKYISKRLGIPTGARIKSVYVLPFWIQENMEYKVRFLRGLYEAEGYMGTHAATYTYKLIFTNRNDSLLNIVYSLITELGFHPHISKWNIQISRKQEVQNLADLLQFRHYGP